MRALLAILAVLMLTSCATVATVAGALGCVNGTTVKCSDISCRCVAMPTHGR